MENGYKNIKKWRNNNKRRMIMSFGGKCGICGYDKCQEALEFHHLNPNEKDFTIQGKCRSWKKSVIELRKCIMVCANCHREIHFGIISIPDDIQRFDESYTNYKPEILFDECPICGGQKLMGRITCSRQCSSKRRNKVDWSLYDLELLYKKYRSYVGVASVIGVSDVSVKKRMKKEGLLPL